jgi:hypothetical protein
MQTQLSTVTKAYSQNPEKWAQYASLNASGSGGSGGGSSGTASSTPMKPNTAIHLGPAGNVSEWTRLSKGWGLDMANAFADALREHGTLIPNDNAMNKRLDKMKKACSVDEFRTKIREDFLGGSGTPHLAHCNAHLSDPEESFVLRKNMFSSSYTGEDVDTPYDSLIGSALEETRSTMSGGIKYTPLPLYLHGKLVAPDDYVNVAKRLVGSQGYLTIGFKLYTNEKNKVQSLKGSLIKFVIAKLGEEQSNDQDDVVTFDFAPKPAEVDAVGVVNVDVDVLAAVAAACDEDDAGDGDEDSLPPAKRAKNRRGF